MPDLSPERRRARARAGGYARQGNHEAADAARRDAAVLALADHVREVIDGFPPLTPEQRDRLAALLRPAVETHHARHYREGAGT